jgi:microcystin degradation protein MlrC
MRRAVALERDDRAVLAAGIYWGNPFTDVPELGSQVVITYDGAAGAAERVAVAAGESVLKC